MPFPKPHNVLQVFGAMQSGTYEDIWSMSLRIGHPGSSTGGVASAPTAAMLDDVAADLTKWWNSQSILFPGTVKMTGFKLNAVGVDGRYISDTATVARSFGTSGLLGTGTTNSLPPQVTLALTLHTETARGLANKGRVFLPPFISTVCQPGGVMSATNAQQAAGNFATLLTDLSNWPGIDAAADPGDVVIASKVREGAMRKVTGVSAGNVLDTQRRRRNNYREARGTIAAVTS